MCKQDILCKQVCKQKLCLFVQIIILLNATAFYIISFWYEYIIFTQHNDFFTHELHNIIISVSKDNI